jgi:NADH-quinone oxidoreductase subunit C
MSESNPRKPPRKRTRRQVKRTEPEETHPEPEDTRPEPEDTRPEPQETRPEPQETRPEPVEGQHEGATISADDGASTSAVLSSSKGSAHIHEESDEKAPVKGAVPEGESEPDADTKQESLTGEAPDVGSGATAAEEDEAQLVAPEPSAEVLQVRKGMFGVKGSGDTSGYGGLTRVVEFPAAAVPPFGGWWDQIYERIGALVPNFSDVITKVVIHRGEITFHVAREHLAELVRYLRDDAHLRFEFCSSVSGVHYPADKDRELHAVYHLQSMTHNRRIRLEVSVPDSDPHIPSVAATYPTADWHERETYDMFGIIFDGHPALTRILMPDDWPGHPQRKDYPLGGIPVEYKGATIPAPDQRRSYS